MQASRVTFLPETRAAMNSPVMDWQKKRNLKIERVKTYIRTKPAGYKFKLYELITAAGYDASNGKGYTAGYAFVKGLGESGILDIEKTAKFRKTVIIRDDETVHVTKPEQETAKDKEPEQAQPETAEREAPLPPVVGGHDIGLVRYIERLAREFSWKNDSNDLREFVRSLK